MRLVFRPKIFQKSAKPTFNDVIGIGLLVGETVGLLVGVTVTDGGCDVFTDRGTFPRDIDIASGINDICDDGDDTGLLGIGLEFLTYDVELDGELVFVIVKLGVIFILDCELFKLAANRST